MNWIYLLSFANSLPVVAKIIALLSLKMLLILFVGCLIQCIWWENVAFFFFFFFFLLRRIEIDGNETPHPRHRRPPPIVPQ
ncbi:hypothetical protein PP707_04680 [Acetobacter pasteurianus]|nr:hypothetical protein [Acetobacter pasteurianus]